MHIKGNSTIKTTETLAKAYNPKDFEERLYQFWLTRRFFSPREEKVSTTGTFVIVIPPPNVTGVLHMGHGLNNSLQDILIRYHRMKGEATLWLPGTDHAGIATQNVVEKRLKAKGLSRQQLGREKFVEETWRVKEEHQAIIRKQLQKIGASCDWERERFTLDEGLSQAVREVFVGLFEKDLIYKGNYLINWCSSCGTAISDDEVEHEEVQGKMYYYYYPLADGSGSLQIATTRPETMLGDTAVAVHPEDERYRAYIGKMVALPLTGRRIPVVGDSYVSKEFGTGAVKVTPAHDPNDYAIAERHNLPKINILNADGTLNNNVPEPYRGLSSKTARQRVVEDLKAAGLFIKEEKHVHQVGHCYRCHTVIEPYLSSQWFVRMQPLAEKALAAWRSGEVGFIPKKWENTYEHWLLNIRDWCISRQLWWGHRIPVWYCRDCGEMIVSRTAPTQCSRCPGSTLEQDPDVLDTWFSSWLWPFSTLGWPEQTGDLAHFYPTTALVTAYDIIFFWVARMIMAGLEFMGEVPFRDVYIHGLVRDKLGRKMSKSLGNGIDPLEIIDEYGADAFRFTLAFLAAQGQDILLDKESFKIGSKFANKLWNAARYILMNAEGRKLLPLAQIELNEADRWILHRLNEAARTINDALQNYRFNDASQTGYEFFWNDFCDWYIEASKLSLYSRDDSEKDRAITLLLTVLEESLRLLHPLLPFITEEIYQKLAAMGVPVQAESIIVAPYPQPEATRAYPEVAANFAIIQELVRAVRTLRSEFTISPDKKIKVVVKAELAIRDLFTAQTELISLLVGAESLTVTGEVASHAGSVPVVGRGFEAFLFIKDVVDLPQEIAKLKKEQAKIRQEQERTGKKLANQEFVAKAPPQVVENEKTKLADFADRLAKIEFYLKELEQA